MDDTEDLQCPYNKTHIVNILRMPYHLMKCRKSHPDIRLSVCPYSALHEVPPAELQFHMANCPDKRLVEGVDPPHALLHALTGKTSELIKGCTDIPPPAKVQFTYDDEEESWDDSASRNYPYVTIQSSTINHRGRLRRNYDDMNPVLPTSAQIRRPFTQSLAESLKPNSHVQADLSRGSSPFSDSHSNDSLMPPLDSLIDSDSLPPIGENSRLQNPSSTATSPAKSVRHEDSVHCTTNTTEDVSTQYRNVIQGRGRAHLLNVLPYRLEKRPGQIDNISPFSIVGRGRSLSMVPANSSVKTS